MADFERLLEDDFQFIGYGDSCVRFMRGKINNREIIANMRGATDARKRAVVNTYRRQARRHADEAKDVRWRYPVTKLCETYNGNGAEGSGGPKTEWLRAA